MSFWYNHEASLSEMKEFSFDLPKPARRHFTQQSRSVKRMRTASNHKQPKKQKTIELKRKAQKNLDDHDHAGFKNTKWFDKNN